jgi:hypothetical protein
MGPAFPGFWAREEPGNAGGVAASAFVGFGLAFLGFSTRKKPRKARRSQSACEAWRFLAFAPPLSRSRPCQPILNSPA